MIFSILSKGIKEEDPPTDISPLYFTLTDLSERKKQSGGDGRVTVPSRVSGTRRVRDVNGERGGRMDTFWYLYYFDRIQNVRISESQRLRKSTYFNLIRSESTSFSFGGVPCYKRCPEKRVQSRTDRRKRRGVSLILRTVTTSNSRRIQESQQNKIDDLTFLSHPLRHVDEEFSGPVLTVWSNRSYPVHWFWLTFQLSLYIRSVHESMSG